MPAGDAEAAVRATGWTLLRVAANSFQESYDVVATRGLAALRIRRRGVAPDVDGWTAGRELLFSRLPLVGGATPPRRLDALHVGVPHPARHAPGRAERRALRAARRRRRRRGGATRRCGDRRSPGSSSAACDATSRAARKPIDALVLPVPSGPGRPSAAVVERFISSPPWFVAGRARPLLGRRVCFAGRTSGPDNCGRIVRSYPGAGGLPCTTIIAREGDSGAPVYTEPRADGTVRAVGIANIVFGLLQSMCFVPLGPTLDALDATLVTAPPS